MHYSIGSIQENTIPVYIEAVLFYFVLEISLSSNIDGCHCKLLELAPLHACSTNLNIFRGFNQEFKGIFKITVAYEMENGYFLYPSISEANGISFFHSLRNIFEVEQGKGNMTNTYCN